MTQSPQWDGSIEVSTQVELHCVWPAPHVVRQTPPVHTKPAAQATPHAPQLALSV